MAHGEQKAHGIHAGREPVEDGPRTGREWARNSINRGSKRDQAAPILAILGGLEAIATPRNQSQSFAIETAPSPRMIECALLHDQFFCNALLRRPTICQRLRDDKKH
jgi:hypothetical protein